MFRHSFVGFYLPKEQTSPETRAVKANPCQKASLKPSSTV